MMSQAEYLSRLEYLLQDMPAERKWELLDDIRQHFDEGIASGVPEDEIARNLGAPELLAKEYLGGGAPSEGPVAPRALPVPVRPKRERRPGAWGKIWRATALFFLNVVLMLAVFITLYALWFSFAATGVGLFFGGVLSSLITAITRIIPIPFVRVSYPMLTFVSGITLSALGGMMLLWTRSLLHGLLRLTGRYLNWNRRVMNGGHGA